MVANPRLEALGPAERVVAALTTYADHLYHGRPGVVTPDPRSPVGVVWTPATWKLEGAAKVVYRLDKGVLPVRLGELDVATGRVAGATGSLWRDPGLFPETVAWMYGQIAGVWGLDNEFAARLASWAYARDHRDMKVVLAAFLLVQSRAGLPERGADGEVEFYDDDYRDVGEAMCLLRGAGDLNPKLLLRVGQVLSLPEVAAINRERGFGRSGRRPAMGRYPLVVEKWLRHREDNPRLLDGLVKAGFRTTVMALCRKVGYRPSTERFFEVLRWKQVQAKDGRRTLSIGKEVAAAESWAGLTERAVCERIVATRYDWKRVVGLLPGGVTKAVVAAAIEAGSLSDKDLIILTPTLEDLGLLAPGNPVHARWEAATRAADDQRAANIAKRVKSAAVAEKLADAVDTATASAIEAVTRNLRVWVLVDISGSMEGAIAAAKVYLAKFLGGFPLDRTHVAVFNTMGREVVLKSGTAAAVDHAFRAFSAGGGTDYVAGVRALQRHPAGGDEDLLVLFVGDEGDPGAQRLADVLRPFSPAAFGLLKVPGVDNGVVRGAAELLGIPLFPVDPAMFDDPYAVTRVLCHLIATTPVGKATPGRVQRKSLVEEILDTPLLVKPAWA